MRKPSPLYCLTSMLLAFAACSAYAVAPVAASGVPAPAAASPAPVPTGTPPPAAQSSSTTTSTTTSTTGGMSSSAAPRAGTSNAATIRNENSNFSNEAAVGPTTDAASFGPDSSFTNDNGNPELGLSPGQTSSGTAAGVAPNGLDVGSNLDTNPGATIGLSAPAGAAGAFVPGTVMGGGYGGASGAGGSAVGGTAIALSPGSGSANRSATPLLDQATRNAAQRDAHRRATGDTPRIIGIAPRTDADRTDQMPDDPIIRY